MKKKTMEENVLFLGKWVCFREGRQVNDCLKHIFPARGDTRSRTWVAEIFAVDVRDG